MRKFSMFVLAGALLAGLGVVAGAGDLYDLSPQPMERTAQSVVDPNVSFPVPMYDDDSDGFADRVVWLGVTTTWDGNFYVGGGLVIDFNHTDPGMGWDWDALVTDEGGPPQEYRITETSL